MMAGIVPKRSNSGRKQWHLYDGPRSSTKSLRNHMASDGCSESQVVLAKQLLEEQCEEVSQRKENARLAVYWLIKSSEQGNIEATDLLKVCLHTGRGITELNYLDVKTCITMTQDEKLARNAAREVFASLSNGGEYITSNQLQRRILSIDREEAGPSSSSSLGQHEDLPPSPSQFDESGTEENGDLRGGGDATAELPADFSYESAAAAECANSSTNEKLTEDDLVSAAVNYAHGYLPNISRALCLFEPDLHALDHVPLIQKPILHPWLSIKILYFRAIRFLSRQLVHVLSSRDVLLLLAALLYMAVYTQIFWLFPVLLYYFSFAVMVISTVHMLQNKREFHEFHLWSGLFICYSQGRLNADNVEYYCVSNSLKPYGMFFVALLINLFLYPTVVEEWIPRSELMVVSFCLTIMTLLGFMSKQRAKATSNAVMVLSFVINVLTKYPYYDERDATAASPADEDIDLGGWSFAWEFLDFKLMTPFVTKDVEFFVVNFRMLLYACVPVIFVKMAAEENWRGTFKTLIPHCVTLTWLQLCIVSSCGVTSFELLKGSLILVGLLFSLPLIGLTSVALPAAALTQYVLTSNLVVNICLFIVIATMSLVVFRICAQTRYKKLLAIVQIVSTFTAAFTLLNPAAYYKFYKEDIGYESGGSGKIHAPEPSQLSWELYYALCHQQLHLENSAPAQIRCAKLRDAPVEWTGHVTSVRIRSITNTWQSFYDRFPASLRHLLYCLHGEKPDEEDDTTGNICDGFTHHEEVCNAVKSLGGNECSLEKYDRYTFEIALRMHSDHWGKMPEIRVVADDFFKNFTLNLKANDHVWVKGTLCGNAACDRASGFMDTAHTHVRLEEMGCLACADWEYLSKVSKLSEAGNTFRAVAKMKDVIISGVKFILNVLFQPVVYFK